MRKLVFSFFVFLGLASCENEKVSNNVVWSFLNKTDEPVRLNIYVLHNEKRLKWDTTLAENGKYDVTFNIKKELKMPEGGFIFTGTFPDGTSVETNTGYFTNYVYSARNPGLFEITKDAIVFQK